MSLVTISLARVVGGEGWASPPGFELLTLALRLRDSAASNAARARRRPTVLQRLGRLSCDLRAGDPLAARFCHGRDLLPRPMVLAPRRLPQVEADCTDSSDCPHRHSSGPLSDRHVAGLVTWQARRPLARPV